MKKSSSFLLAASALAVAGMASAADMPKGASGKAIGAADKVHCYNVNSCKGSSDCKTTENSCKGHNACKGHGFKGMAAQECLSKGGTIADVK